MKEVVAYIKPHKLGEVTLALQKVKGLRGMTVAEVKGFGRREPQDPSSHVDEIMDFARYTRIEIFCHDDLVEELLSVINRKAYTGLRGDGKIYVLDVEKSIKVGRGEITLG